MIENPKDFDLLVENAFDFLRKAIAEASPKFSIIHFYSAVELFLKARLLEDHWSLVVLKDPNRKKFEAGDFNSVSFDSACERLDKIVCSALPDAARASFDVLRKHRNQMVHFHHAILGADAELLARVARDQLQAWHHLKRLLTKQWVAHFGSGIALIEQIDESFARHREYYTAKFVAVQKDIVEAKATGASFSSCAVCKFEAAQQEQIAGSLHRHVCLVCGVATTELNLDCTECEQLSSFAGGDFTCDHCGHTESEGAIADRLNEFMATKHNYFDAKVPANCRSCEGYHSVVEYGGGYLCVACTEWVPEVEACGFCNEFNTGDMSDSYLSGCGHCDGKLRWDDD